MQREIFSTSPSIIGFKVVKFGHFQDFSMKILHELSILMLLTRATSSLEPQREKIINYIFHRQGQVNHCIFRLVSKISLSRTSIQILLGLGGRPQIDLVQFDQATPIFLEIILSENPMLLYFIRWAFLNFQKLSKLTTKNTKHLKSHQMKL